MIILLIITFILNCGIAFLLSFCFDEAKIWGSFKFTPAPHQPNLEDLHEEELVVVSKNDTDEEAERKHRKNDYIDYKNAEQRKKYTDEVIAPSYHYLNTLNEVKKHNDIGDDFYAYLILHLSSIALMTFVLFKLEIFKYAWLCAIISILVCVFSSWIISLIYRKTPLVIKDFGENIEELIELWKMDYDDATENKSLKFNISKENFVNNCIIEEHSKYLFHIKETVLFRKHIRKLLYHLAMIIYFLFFLTIPEY